MSYKTYRSSGAAAISITVSPGEPWELEGIKVHLSAAGAAGNLTVTVDSAHGSAYNTVLFTQAMVGLTDVDKRWNPTQKFISKNDKVVIAYTNTGSKTWGIEVTYKALG